MDSVIWMNTLHEKWKMNSHCTDIVEYNVCE